MLVAAGYFFFMEDIPLCSKLCMNIVKQAPSKHNFYYNVVNNHIVIVMEKLAYIFLYNKKLCF